MYGSRHQDEIEALLILLHEALPEHSRSIIEGMMMGGDGLAMEHLCDHLSEHEVALSPFLYHRVITLASECGAGAEWIACVPPPR